MLPVLLPTLVLALAVMGLAASPPMDDDGSRPCRAVAAATAAAPAAAGAGGAWSASSATPST